jgi:acyl-CoA synthetase (AMP-forming)/AMP-acid ligase II
MIAPSTNFVLPPTDGSLPLNSVVDFHLKHNPQHPWAILSATDDTPEVTVTYAQLAHAVHHAAHIVNPNASLPQGTKVGILATADTIVYLTLILGVLRAGLIVSLVLDTWIALICLYLAVPYFTSYPA